MYVGEVSPVEKNPVSFWIFLDSDLVAKFARYQH